MEKKEGCEVTFPLKKPENENQSFLFLPDYVTPTSGSGYQITDFSVLQELISASRCSFCKVRQDNKKQKEIHGTLLLFENLVEKL